MKKYLVFNTNKECLYYGNDFNKASNIFSTPIDMHGYMINFGYDYVLKIDYIVYIIDTEHVKYEKIPHVENTIKQIIRLEKIKEILE